MPKKENVSQRKKKKALDNWTGLQLYLGGGSSKIPGREAKVEEARSIQVIFQKKKKMKETRKGTASPFGGRDQGTVIKGPPVRVEER